MTTANNANTKLAVLIDADNAPADIIDRLLEEIAKYGIASVKRIYGDWSHGLSKWKAALLPHAIIPVQQFAYTKGKNATDMALVIDAMDLLYSGNFDGFCIVSSDSDFTRLASRLRESGRTVYGFGEKKTPEAFRKACDKFVYTEIFRPHKNQTKARSDGKNSSDADSTTEPAADALTLIKRAVRENADDLGWANLGPIGSYINKTNPDFDSRLYGYGKLSELIKSFDIFEHRTDNNQLQVRRRSDKAADKTETKQPESQKQPENTANNADAVESQAKGRKPRKTGSEGSLKSQENAAAETPAAQPKPAAKAKNGKLPVTRVIPTVQQAVDAAADAEGWARLSDVLKQLAALNINPQNYGFDTDRELIHAIYADWLEIKKAGRGERLRVNKRFVSKD
ncbi:NYN domain-containing protein [Kingella sp. SNUBH-2017]|uniref:NYN domain-containing protein n=1 Tax=Kingella sp. SNUBH-2017 TaxID=2994077 RepID=UPI0023637D3E|nr:NYN domain-containing protein [Kingella sp. SNUBH-2017]MDD2182391.1 NYN domain-containing protein [Kingella sp. SNUBH-2017]